MLSGGKLKVTMDMASFSPGRVNNAHKYDEAL